MKKITLLTAFVTVCAFAFAQTKMAQVQNMPLSKKVKSFSQLGAYNQVSKPANNGAINAKKAVIWSETFAGGIPGGWSNTGTPAAALWEYRGPATTPNVTIGGRGDCSSGVPIASPTAANGFMIFDSNWLDPNTYCGGPAGGTAAAPQISILQTDAINLSAEPSVQLTFYTDMREFSGTQSVNVSIDGGTIWTEVWEAGLGTNVDFAGLISVNITSIAANQADVRLQFDWDGDYYEWMIDDITLETAPNFDLALVTDSDMVYLNAWQVPLYGQIPINQTDTTIYAARVANNGNLTQTNVILNVNVKNGVTSVFNSSDTLASLASFTDSLLTISPAFSPVDTGTYTVIFNVSSDSTDANLADNSDTISYKITDTVFARDDNSTAQYYLNVAGYGLSGPTPNGSSYEFGNWYETVNADTATSISVVFGANTVVGTLIKGKIYADDGTTMLRETAFYTILAGNVGTFPNFPTTTIPLTAKLTLGDTTNYVVTIADYSGSDTATTIIGIADDHKFGTSFVYASTTYTIAETPFVRLNLTSADVCTAVLTDSVSNITCFGANNGAIDLTVTGGTTPFTYLWSNAATTQDISSLSAGTYSVVVTDGLSCVDSLTGLVVTEPAALSLTPDSATATCGAPNGSATVDVTGGTLPYAYLWAPGSQTTAIATGLSGGTYTVTVTDGNGCTAFKNVTVPATPAVVFTTSKTDPTSCVSGDGTATATVTSGTPPYVYQWIPGLQDSSTATGLSSGTYQITVTDSNGCSANANVILVDAAAAILTISDSTMVSCNGGSNGSANVNASGGVLPYTYSWNTTPGQTDSTATGLADSTYIVTVTDAAGCSSGISVTITQPSAVVLNTSVTGVSCFGGANGTAKVTASGGTPGYSYLWNTVPPATTDSVSGLSAGTYKVYVTDANLCVDSASAVVGTPALLTVTLSGKTNETAAGLNNGTMSVSASGGTGTYTYNWVPAPGAGQGTASVTGLAPAVYTVTVTDANGCDTSLTDTIAAGPIGIAEKGLGLTFNIYPNPTKGQFIVEFNNQKKDDYLIEVRNIIGQLIYSEEIDISGKFTKQIDLSGHRGVYFISIKNSSNTRTEKLVVY